MNERITIGVDLGKSAIQLHGQDDACRGRALKKRLRRAQVLSFFSNRKPALIGIEACSGAHYWGRELTKLGHTVKLMPPQYVKPYVKTNKNDGADAEGCWEAVTRPNMRFVPIKSAEQQAVLQLHRERERLVRERTKIVNQVYGFLLEYGVTISKSVKRFAANATEALGKHAERLPNLAVHLIERCVDDFLRIDERVEFCERQMKEQNRENPRAQALDTIRGVGPITASAACASVGNAEAFKNGRHFAAWLGLVPQQDSSGDTIRLGRMSKRGNPYLRKLLIQGAHSVLRIAQTKDDPHSVWLRRLVARCGICKAAVTLANKNARIIFALLQQGDGATFSPARAHSTTVEVMPMAA